jgi:hypothetical protein
MLILKSSETWMHKFRVEVLEEASATIGTPQTKVLACTCGSWGDTWQDQRASVK